MTYGQIRLECGTCDYQEVLIATPVAANKPPHLCPRCGHALFPVDVQLPPKPWKDNP